MKTNQDTLGLLYDATIKNLLAKIEDGTATAADLSVARAMLRDANITPPKGVGHPAEKLATKLPFSEPESDEATAH